jgi:hypothetical protein
MSELTLTYSGPAGVAIRCKFPDRGDVAHYVHATETQRLLRRNFRFFLARWNRTHVREVIGLADQVELEIGELHITVTITRQSSAHDEFVRKVCAMVLISIVS